MTGQKTEFELEPRYSTSEISGKCLKCLGEEEMDTCLRALLRNESNDEHLIIRYQMLVAFLQSPAFEHLRQRSEKLLSEGKQVKIRARTNTVTGETQYTLVVKPDKRNREE